jgi:D-alanyl-D-alanine carboxypeptidase
MRRSRSCSRARAIDPGLANVTLAELASHRAGLPRDPEDVSDEERARILAIPDATEQRRVLLERELARPPATPRGEFVYSNVGFVLLGAAIERAVGAPFENAMVERLFAPLEMHSCGFAVPEGEGAYGHAADGSLAGAETVIPLAYAPAGGVHCTSRTGRASCSRTSAASPAARRCSRPTPSARCTRPRPARATRSAGT